jgi:hypothetical protein
VAQYGRGTGVIQSVATQIVNQFAANLGRMIDDAKTGGAGPDQRAGRAGTVADTAPATKPIGVFALLWSVLRDRMRALFARN